MDTSVAVPLLVATHLAHPAVVQWAGDRELVLAGHAAAETYSVLTRLPGDVRVAPDDASLLMDESFGQVLTLPRSRAAMIHRELAALGVVGGAVYDALVALCARDARVALATRDARALSTYELTGVEIVLLPG